MRRLSLLVSVVAVSACTTAGNATTTAIDTVDAMPVGDRVSLTRVLDGDSIAVRRADGSEDEVRLIGINAPEGAECHGDAARLELESLLTGEELILVGDEQDDQFGRLLRYVYSDGVHANLEMVSGGHALPLQSGHRLEGAFVDAAAAAATAGSGMWSSQACGSQTRIPLIEIADYVFDAAGPDAENPNGERVQFVNRDDRPVDLSGWIIRDESTRHRLVLPTGLELDSGSSITVFSGCGNATAADIYWCAGPVWSNGGDTIILQLSDGTIVAWERYAGDF